MNLFILQSINYKMSNLVIKKSKIDLTQRLRQLQAALNLTQEEIAKTGGRQRVNFAEYIREQNPKVPGADFIANLVLNTGVNANWLLTGQGEMFNPELNTVETGLPELGVVYQKLGEKERALLVEIARTFAGLGSQQ